MKRTQGACWKSLLNKFSHRYLWSQASHAGLHEACTAYNRSQSPLSREKNTGLYLLDITYLGFLSLNSLNSFHMSSVPKSQARKLPQNIQQLKTSLWITDLWAFFGSPISGRFLASFERSCSASSCISLMRFFSRSVASPYSDVLSMMEQTTSHSCSQISVAAQGLAALIKKTRPKKGSEFVLRLTRGFDASDVILAACE